MKIALAQINPVIGDISGNAAKITRAIEQAIEAGADMVAFSELSLIGYPPHDLVFDKRLLAEASAAVEALTVKCANITAIVGYVRRAESGALQNVAAVLQNSEIRHVHVKSRLCKCGLFGEHRYFIPAEADTPQTVEVAGTDVCLMIGECVTATAGQVIVNLAASPYYVGNAVSRETHLADLAAKAGAPIVFINQVGGNDEIIFDGASCVVCPDSQVLARAKSFEEDLLIVDTNADNQRCEPLGGKIARISAALKLGLGDYVRKCGFSGVVLGLSGGVDSAVVASLSAEALGPENVHVLLMPSRYSSDHSLADARKLAENLGIEYQVMPIEPIHSAFEKAMGWSPDEIHVASENIQARIRGSLLMSFSNEYGYLPLATGNK